MQPLTNVDQLLLDRWVDTCALKDAIKELEERLSSRLKSAAEKLEPWFESKGYSLLSTRGRYAEIQAAKPNWLKKGKEEYWIAAAVGAVYPFGYRSVGDDNPYVWLYADGLSKAEQQLFQLELTNRLKNHVGGWVNEYSDPNQPIGRYLTSHGDIERAQLAQSDSQLELFVKASFELIFELESEIEHAYRLARPK
jgi:hypothetical protein